LGHPIPPPTASVTRKCVRVGNGSATKSHQVLRT
jgi:hypothetical protein